MGLNRLLGMLATLALGSQDELEKEKDVYVLRGGGILYDKKKLLEKEELQAEFKKIHQLPLSKKKQKE